MASRRDLLIGAAGATIAVACRASREPAAPEAEPAKKRASDEGIAPTEDLMREHGVLQRVMIVYDECARRLETPSEALPPALLPAAARLVRAFVHDYHEKMEEDAVFPRCERGLVHVALVRTLREQHAVGRKLTDYIEVALPKERKKLAGALRAFNRMYRAHAGREDTVLFPAFRDLLEPSDLAALSERFEEREHALFGDDGFERKVMEVSELETAVDLSDLARVTADAR